MAVACLLSVIGVSWCVRAAAKEERVFRAGAHAEDITPEFPISVNGGMTDRTATVAHDRLHARALVLDDGMTSLAIVVCDSCVIPRGIMDEAKENASKSTGIPTSNMLVSATHTHSAPTATEVFQSKPDPKYLKKLAAGIAAAIEKAHANRVPARIGWGVGQEPNQVFNRRWRMKPGTIRADPFGKLTDQVQMNPPIGSENLLEPAGPTDPEVWVLAVKTLEGKPISLLADYSLHYVGDVPGGAVSADYFGAFAERMTGLLQVASADPPFVGILANGTSGDINNINFRTAHAPVPTFGRIRLVADAVAKVAFETYQSMPFHDWVPLSAKQRELELGVRKPTPEELAYAREILANAKGKPLAQLQEIYANETVAMNDYPDKVRLIVQALRIGDLGIAAIPCETFVSIGLSIKRQSARKPVFTIELANGYNGYLPTAEQHALGGYETWRARSSYLEVGAAAAIESAVLELLQELKKGDKQ
ncbi:MAG: neutral/alkaline non-lysosomal ceramidase N-terminal domain-containing protein [Planctomycetota bacterium]